MATSFRGGIYLNLHKDQAAKRRVETPGTPEELVIPLPAGSQPQVCVGDRVLRGQCIADSEDPCAVPVHAGISGTVVSVESRLHPCGEERLHIVVESDGQDEAAVTHGVAGWENAPAQVLLDAIRAAGIPEYTRLCNVEGIDTIIISGVENVPCDAATHRVMLEQAGAIADGARVLCRIFPEARLVIGVEARKSDAMALLRRMIRNEAAMRVEGLSSKYPQGSPELLVSCITGRRLQPGQRPEETGCVVLGVAAAASIGQAVVNGTPEYACTLTVAGEAVATPRNLRVPVGMTLKALADLCGGLVEEPEKVLVGDPVRGMAQPDLWVSVDKRTQAVLFLTGREDGRAGVNNCIRCGRCTQVCPMCLMPGYLYEFASKGLYEDCKSLHIRACIECGTCGCVCPGGLALPDVIRRAKRQLEAE